MSEQLSSDQVVNVGRRERERDKKKKSKRRGDEKKMHANDIERPVFSKKFCGYMRMQSRAVVHKDAAR